jgi:hypothetical protein
VTDPAVLALDRVEVNGRTTRLYAFADRLELVDETGLRVVALTDVARITSKSGLRRGHIVIEVQDGETLVVRRLKSADAGVAFRLLVGLARDANG